MKIFVKILPFILVLVSVFSGCGGEKKNKESQNSSVEFPERIQADLSETVSVRADCQYPESCKTGKAKRAALGTDFFWEKREELKQIFFRDREIEKEYLNEFEGLQECTYLGEEESVSLYIDTNNHLRYSGRGAEYIENVIVTDEKFSDYNGEQYRKEIDFSFQTREEAWEEIQLVLEELGIPVPENYKCYVMEHSVMEQEEKRLLQENQEIGGKTESKPGGWSQEDDCYYFTACITWEDYRILPEMMGEGLSENNLSVIYNKEGILAFSINGYYPLKEAGMVTVQSPEKAAEKAQELLENIISEDVYEIQKLTLCQKVLGFQYEKKKADIVPVWECQILVKSKDSEIQDYIEKLYFNAETLTGI